MKARLSATAIGVLSLVWGAVGLYILKLASEPRGEAEDVALVFVSMLILAVLGLALSARTVFGRRGVLPLGIFAAAVAVVSALNVVIVPLAAYGPWTATDTLVWLLLGLNTAILAVAGWTLCRQPRRPAEA